MTRTNKEKILAIYRKNLRRYEDAGDTEQAEIQRRLIKRMEEKENGKTG
ncbi:MAG: hypothetical protein AAGD43_29855 [Pseudomonadota bacterium]